MNINTFTKEEKLKSRKEIERLFKDKLSKSVAQYPLRLVWLPVETPRGTSPVQFTVSVSKRRFKTAVQRNRLKRQVREVWRLQKQALYEILTEAPSPQYAFMVIYTGQEPVSYAVISNSMSRIVRKFLMNI